MLRTHTCGELRMEHINAAATLCGWVHKIRDKGKLIWIDIRDRYGVTQLILEPNITPLAIIQEARKLGREYVIQATGKVVARLTPNKMLSTGAIELQVQEIVIMNPATLPPFLIEEHTDGQEELRMTYRYLDLRRAPLQGNIILRHQVMQYTRTYLNQQRFLEIETPMLIKSTPEGARDFVIPARLYPGSIYALPQSPQIFKQLLMIAGFDRYYQIVKCFRDEDLRADRQPEFTQIDCELSFVIEEDIFNIFEHFIIGVFKHICNITLPPFIRMTYQEAMELYGTDKPDLRFKMPFIKLTQYTKQQGINIFDDAELILGICVHQYENYPHHQLDQLTIFIKQLHPEVQQLVYIRYHQDDSIQCSINHLSQDQLMHWVATMNAKPGDLLLIIAGDTLPAQQALGALRVRIAKELDLYNKNEFLPLWIVDFPLLTWHADLQKYSFTHHPFTSPHINDIELLDKQPSIVRSKAYDLVINGIEIGGGSIRIHDAALQEKMFRLLDLSKEATQQFGFFLDALKFGTPPHGGIAIGLDRLCSLLGEEESIRSYIAFPKNNAGRDVMAKTPAPLSRSEWQTLGLQLLKNF